MIQNLKYKSSRSGVHHYELVDGAFTTMSTVSTASPDYVNTMFDEMAIIVKEYTARQLPVAPNITLHLHTKYCGGYSRAYGIKRFNEHLDEICDKTVSYYPYADINKYKPCILRQLDQLLWAQKNCKR